MTSTRAVLAGQPCHTQWHMGAVAEWMTPHSRGFNTSLGYLSGGEDHFTQVQRGNIFGVSGVDLWATKAPAYGKNGSYSAYTYSTEIERIIGAHDPKAPLFVYIAPQDQREDPALGGSGSDPTHARSATPVLPALVARSAW